MQHQQRHVHNGDPDNDRLFSSDQSIDRQKYIFTVDANKEPSILKSSRSNIAGTTRDIQAKLLLRNDVNRKQTTVIHQAAAGPIPIILLTYMRSGSSFVGNLLKANPKTFYSFEPLHMLQRDVRKERPMRYLDGTLRNYKNFVELSVETMADLSTCKMENLPLSFYEDSFFYSCTDSSKFNLCMNKRKIEANLQNGRNCTRVLSNACKESEYFVAKIIRMPLYALEPLLEKIPTLKIIHLLRDPRATVSSQVNAVRYTMNTIQSSVVDFCNRVYEDIVSREALERKYPGRLMTTEYGDIVKEPIRYTKQLYEFSGMNFTQHVENEIVRLSSNTRNGVNFTVISSIWRANAKLTIIEIVDNNCQQLYKKLGLMTLSIHDLQNVSVSVKLKSPPAFNDFRNE